MIGRSEVDFGLQGFGGLLMAGEATATLNPATSRNDARIITAYEIQ